MDSLYILIPIAMVFSALAIAAYLWAVNSGQYDDLEKEASQILFDDPSVFNLQNEKTNEQSGNPQTGCIPTEQKSVQ
ncbi:MAG: cbb3-type cytochrome oxidase assembly protein CcoS [Pseudomonadales bacterium]|nr:cbb3-type cytochrome oxidase assembly protein CcoS [Pseudomonadales bacterium]